MSTDTLAVRPVVLGIQISDDQIDTLGEFLKNEKNPLKARLGALHTLRNTKVSSAIKEIGDCFSDSSTALKHELAYSLGQMQFVEAISILSGVLANFEEHAVVRHEAAEALGAIGSDECIGILKNYEKDPVLEVAESVELALKRIADISTVTADEPREQRNPYHSVDPALPMVECQDLEMLMKILIDEKLSLYQRYQAMFTLRDICNKIVKTLELGLKAKSALFRHEIASVLGQLRNCESVEVLTETLKDLSENEMVRRECAVALGAIGTSDCKKVLKEFLTDSKRIVKESCEVALDIAKYEIIGNSQHTKTILESRKYGRPKRQMKQWAYNDPPNVKSAPVHKQHNAVNSCLEPGCKQSFSKLRELNRHIKAHRSGKIAGECDRCGKKFKTLGGLKIHYAAHVRDDNKYVCKNCGKKFRKQETLQFHEKTDHHGYKPHMCPHTDCGKTFRLKDKLKLHIMVIHDQKKPFPCPKCQKSFRTKYHLKIHDVSQHIQGGDTAIGCSLCKRKFPDTLALEKHAAIHQQDKNFTCSTCGKGFLTAPRLKLHEKSHQEVPSCLCPVCGRAYKHIRDLRLHEVVHQDESTYRFGCGDCPRRFYRVDLLRVHQSNEKHFATEVIGPTVSKSQPGGKDASFYQVKDPTIDDDEEEDENETDSESTPLPPSQTKKKHKVLLRRHHKKMQHTPEMTVIHPHTTVIYHPHPSTIVQVQLDPSVSGTQVTKANSALPSTSTTIMNNLTMPTNQQRHNHESQANSYFVTQRDRHNVPHHSGIQIQSSTGQPHIQFGNQTIYTNPINMSNVNSTAEQIGFDFIQQFGINF